MKKRGLRKTRVGHVISDRMEKTVVVVVTRRVKHPVYKKYFNKRSKFYAHSESNEARMGDLVKIRETKPLSKLKRWEVIEVLKKGLLENAKGAA